MQVRLSVSTIVFQVLVCALSICSTAQAASPKDKSVQSLRLGMSPDQAQTLLQSAYQACEVSKKFHPSETTANEGDAAAQILAELALETGEIGKTSRKFSCNQTDVIDKFNLKFLSAESDIGQPLYEIAYLRFYGDPAIDSVTLIQYPFESIRKSLFDQYGNPSGQLRIKTSVNQPAVRTRGKITLPAGNDYESFNITYVWGGKGLRAQSLTYCMENCGDYYLIANLNIVKRKALLPRNTFYVRSVSLKMVDSILEEKQFDWSYQKLHRKPE